MRAACCARCVVMLRELQHALLADLFDPSGTRSVDAIRPVPGRAACAALAIYRDSVIGAMSAALAAAYPVCQALVGAGFFRRMAASYIERHPSTQPDLDRYGAQLPEFIEAYEAAAGLGYLADVARLEWAWQCAFYAPEPAPFDAQALAGLAAGVQEDIVFEPAPGAALLHSPYPVQRIWQLHQASAGAEPETLELTEGAVTVFVWRHAERVRMAAVDGGGRELLVRLAAGQTLGEICAGLAALQPPVDPAAVLAYALQAGWIGGYHLRPVS